MATALHVSLLAPVALALVSSALTYWQGWTYFSGDDSFEEETSSEPVGRGASVIVPLRGAGEEGIPAGFEGLIESLLGQDGVQPIEVIVAVEEAGDPAVARARGLAQSHDQVRLVVAEEEGAEGTGKIANLIAGVSQARCDRIVFVDADVRLWPGALRDLLRPLSDRSVGVAFAAQVGANSPNLPTAFNHMYVNDSAFTQGAAAYRGELPGAVGAFMATRRDVLDAVGGLSAFADQIVMDIPLGQTAKEAGYDLHLLRRPVRVGGDLETWADVLRRQHRWMVSIRAFVPSFPAFVVGASLPQTWSLFFLIGAALRDAFLGTALAALGLAVVWKIGSAAFVNMGLTRDEGLWRRIYVAVVAEPIWLTVFLWSLVRSRVYWAGRWFEVEPDGSKQLVEATAN